MPEEINWVEVTKPSLPEDIKDDKLAVLIQFLLAKVKDDHMRYQFNKDVRHYSKDIEELLNLARDNGYRKVTYNTKPPVLEEVASDSLDEEVPPSMMLYCNKTKHRAVHVNSEDSFYPSSSFSFCQ